MAVDSALKRMSATMLLVPSMTGVFPGTAGVSPAERQAVSWIYSGILAGAVAVVTKIRRGLLLGVY